MENPTPLPEVSHAVAHDMAVWIKSHEGMQRTPVGSAKILTLAVLLHRKRLPWPRRQAVADHLGVSRPLVDLVISQRCATGDVTLRLGATPGSVASRPSVVRQRYVVPSDEIIKAVDAAERAGENAKRRSASTAELAALARAIRSEVLPRLKALQSETAEVAERVAKALRDLEGR